VGVNRRSSGRIVISWEGWVGPRASREGFGENKLPCPFRNSSAGPSTKNRNYRLHGLLGGRGNRRIKYRICCLFKWGIFYIIPEVCDDGVMVSVMVM
jgi:hypothetical protein